MSKNTNIGVNVGSGWEAGGRGTGGGGGLSGLSKM